MTENETNARERYSLGAKLAVFDSKRHSPPLWNDAPVAWKLAPSDFREGYLREYAARTPTFGYL